MIKNSIRLLATMMLFASINGFAGGKDGKTSEQYRSGLAPTSLGKLTDDKIQGKYCVIKDTKEMRLNHMKYMKHRRIETTRKGMRHAAGVKKNNFSISGCINCHGWKKRDNKVVALSAKDKDHFCVSCHRYTAISIDCFSCHQSKPTGPVPTTKSHITFKDSEK